MKDRAKNHMTVTRRTQQDNQRTISSCKGSYVMKDRAKNHMTVTRWTQQDDQRTISFCKG